MAFVIVVDMLNDVMPGCNYWRERQDDRDRIAAAEEDALQRESIKSVNTFMDEAGDTQK